jgi:hypothetical protein
VSEQRPATGLLLGGGLVLAIGLWIAAIFAAVRQTPGWEGWLTGIFAGGFLALLTYLACAWAAVALLRPRRAREAPGAYTGDSGLEQVLAELEAARQDTKARITRAAFWRVPLGVALAVGLWVWSQSTDDPADGSDLIAFIVVGAIAGYFWAAWQLSEAYRRRYKARVLPRIAARFGALDWRPAQAPLDDYRRHRLFPDWDAAKAEDEIVGDYRGLPLSIVELTLTQGSGKKKRTVFHGLTCAVTLPRGLSGATVVVPDKGMFGNLAERLRGGPCEPVRLEDPDFEKAYEVYASDQISARALLTPAFMERFMALARSGRFGAPAALVQDNRLLMALASTGGRDLFEPPSYLKPAAARDAVAQLHDDIEAVLRAADAVIDLDQAARLQPRAPLS